jgi:hypothetical protein
VGEAKTQEGRWIEGRNGGRLRPGGTHGPKRATVLVRSALVEALRDPRGGSGKEFFIGLKTGSAEDRRTFANVVTKLIPVEVKGDMDETLRIVINTFVTGPNGQPLVKQVPCVIDEPRGPIPIAPPRQGAESIQERSVSPQVLVASTRATR